MDEQDGCECDPVTLHRYLYAGNNPITYNDPSGHEGDIVTTAGATAVGERIDGLQSVAQQTLGQKAKKILICQAGKFIVEQALVEGVYLFLQEVAPGIVLPYVGQTGDLPERIAQHLEADKIFEPVLIFIEVAGGKEARRIAEQKIINVLTNGGLRAGVRALPAAERLIANLRNEIRLDKFAAICK